MRAVQAGIVGGLVLGSSASGDARFKLLEPASWIVSNDRGDPRKRVRAAATPKIRELRAASSATR